jgi:hypothetical protein
MRQRAVGQFTTFAQPALARFRGESSVPEK